VRGRLSPRAETPEAELLTGAEAVAAVLHESGVRVVFAYPGTSELVLCDRIARLPGIRLVNGRGDGPSAFMAAGASLLTPVNGAAILHGARGLTNAAGALADIRRNEVGTVWLVGLPSTASAEFLPPHGEFGLMKAMGTFARWWKEIGPVPEGLTARSRAGDRLVQAVRTAVLIAKTPPWGPALIGLPQDVCEETWVPRSCLRPQPPIEVPTTEELCIREVAQRLLDAKRPLILFDDYFLKYRDGRALLDQFANLLAAPVLQSRYRRGPMLFERVSARDVRNFDGPYDPFDVEHQELMARTDLLITLEDRNLYPRVVGHLPGCRKVAINSDGDKVRKNRYLGPSDYLLEGDVAVLLRELTRHLRRDDHPRRSGGRPTRRSWASTRAGSPSPDWRTRSLRGALAGALADVVSMVERPVLVDDSQMLGGLLSEHYDCFPSRLRVMGDHGGFVGAGISYATGLAIGEPDVTVICTLGDQAFTNGCQGLVAAGEQQAPVTLIIANNGGSVSLREQDPSCFDGERHAFLQNAPNLDYAAMAKANGIVTRSVQWPRNDTTERVGAVIAQFRAYVAEGVALRKPMLVELRLPESGDFWEGIWSRKGNDEAVIGSPQHPPSSQVR
jgi:acetolactate synthase-1/2/3 large subunit